MSNKINYKTLTTFLLFVAISLSASAQEAAAAPEAAGNSDSWLYGTLAGIVFLVLFFMTVVLAGARALGREEEKSFSLKEWWASVNARLFKAVPVEKEEDILLDHDYDGIKELDNALPPWWKYGFYVTIGVAVFYLLRFHVFKTGPDPEQEYNKEMQVAAAQIEEYRKSSNDLVDEKTVTLADAAGIAEGDKIFHSNCFACHGAKGEGGVGPNLADNYWLHGGTLNDVFKTIKYGVPDKGMQAWEKTYSPAQIKNLASYIKSLAGTNPPNGKAPQGDLFRETKGENKDVKKDSTSIAKK